MENFDQLSPGEKMLQRRRRSPGRPTKSVIAGWILCVAVPLAGVFEAMVVNSILAGYTSSGAKVWLVFLIALIVTAIAITDNSRRLMYAALSFLGVSVAAFFFLFRLQSQVSKMEAAGQEAARILFVPCLTMLSAQLFVAAALVAMYFVLFRKPADKT